MHAVYLPVRHHNDGDLEHNQWAIFGNVEYTNIFRRRQFD